MTDAQSIERPSLAAPQRRAWAAAEIALIFALFFIQAATPVPADNEAHYLSKAKHYWIHEWCPGDFFCESSDAHLFFYWTFGWVTRWVSLPAAAWIGRVLGWLALAWSWRRLSVSIVAERLYAVLSAAMLVTFTANCSMAGEWVIGGVEAKVFCYALVLVGLERLARDCWNAAWMAFGLAGAFHVVVGGWAAVCGAIVWLTAGRQRPPLVSMLPALVGGLLLALPGLIPAAMLNWNADADTVREANQIYVYERLSHHLLPQVFHLRHVLCFGTLLAGWLALWRVAPRSVATDRLRAFVAGSLALAAIGLVLSWIAYVQPALAASLLRYYWFRLSDVLLPTGVALLAAAYVADLRVRRSAWGVVWLVLLMAFAAAHLSREVWARRLDPRPPADDRLADPQAWRETCEWVANNTPREAVFLTPRLAQSFRWYAGRSEVVNRKDFPQDAAAIVEWSRRLDDIHGKTQPDAPSRWYDSLADEGADRLRELGAKYGADYVITTAWPPLALERISPTNGVYAVYRLQPSQEVPRQK